MCSIKPICMREGSRKSWQMSEVKTQRRKERQCFCWEVWRKQQEESVLFRVTFVKWALLFQLLHYSNTCYWDQHKEVANINVVVWLLDQDMDEYVASHDSHRCFPANFIYFVLVADVDNCYPMSQWCECLGGHGTFPPTPPIFTMHSDVFPQLVMRSVRTCNKQRHVLVCLCVFGWEPLWAI